MTWSAKQHMSRVNGDLSHSSQRYYRHPQFTQSAENEVTPHHSFKRRCNNTTRPHSTPSLIPRQYGLSPTAPGVSDAAYQS